MAIHAALLLALLGSLALAGVLLTWADRVAGARLLALFLAGVAAWAAGNELPSWFGPAWERVGLGLMAVAPVASALFLNFTVRFCRAGWARHWVPAGYGLAAAAAALAILLRPGEYIPYAGLQYVAVPNAIGWAAGVVWGALAAAGHLVLVRTWFASRGLPRRQVEAVCTSSALGMACMAGYAAPAIGWDVYPWPLLALPLYPVILVYGILRYRVLVANAWARRAVAWTLLTGMAALVVALVPLLPLEGVAGRWVSGALVAAACLGLAGPARRLAERLVYPGGTVSADDVEAWRTTLGRAETEAELAALAEGVLLRRLTVPVSVIVSRVNAGPGLAAPSLVCQRQDGRWATTLHGWDAAPPGPRHLAELFGITLAQEAARLERAAALAERERDRQTQARLAELGQLAATVAHDVRNPLNIISMAAAAAPPDSRREIAGQVGRIAQLAQDLLDYAKPWQVEPAEFDLAAQVRATAERYPGLEVGPGLRAAVPVRADARRMEQAVVNLLDNASAAAAGARMAVEAESYAHEVMLHICDAGPGVPMELRDRLFQPFVSRSPGGTGLGLAIVARVMQAHGGTARLTNRPGWNTCVTLTLPAA